MGSYYYIEANILCVIVLGMILHHNHFSLDRRDKQVKYDHVLVSFIFYFLADSAWAGIEAGLFIKELAKVVGFLLYACLAATVYTWFAYALAYLQLPSRKSREGRQLVLVSILLSTVALACFFGFAPQMLIDGELNRLPLYKAFLSVGPDFCIIAILFFTLRKRKTEENPAERKRLLYIGFFPLMAAVAGYLQANDLHDMPVYCFTCLVLMLMFYIDSIENRISIDPLTGLNNRGQLARYCAQKSNLHMEGRWTTVIMIDVDRFKQINDTYGHAEGDKALAMVSAAIQKTVNQCSMPVFACRYGGDEFILIVHPVKMDEADRLIAKIREELELENPPFPLSISAGYDALFDSEDMIQPCMVRADKKLYVDKERDREQK